MAFLFLVLILPFSRPTWWALPESEMARCKTVVEARYRKQYVNILESRLSDETKAEIEAVYAKEAAKEISEVCE